ncbi:MAG TPA: Hpt domain-containing protein [Pseudolabrys sp.]|nr:Hpt domain-containing protein [Pseudolabrys sp.]
MVQVRKSAQMTDAAAEPLGEAIDRAHLRQMTFSDAILEREVLGLFDKQAASMLELISVAEPGALPALAHAVKGSARGIGAWRVAEAAAILEMAPQGNRAPLSAALVEARAAIARILPRN